CGRSARSRRWRSRPLKTISALRRTGRSPPAWEKAAAAAPDPPPPPDYTLWVGPLAALAGAHGWVAVSRTCLRELGYPPAMVTGDGEVQRIRAALNDGGRLDGDEKTLRG